MKEEDYQAALAKLRAEWGRVYVDPVQRGILRAELDHTTGLMAGMRAALFAEIINRALDGAK